MMLTRPPLKKSLVALGVAVLGLFAGSGTAAADGHNVVNPDGTFGAADVSGSGYGTDLVPAVQSVVTSTPPVSHGYYSHYDGPKASYPAGSSYPAYSFWPGFGWGVVDG